MPAPSKRDRQNRERFEHNRSIRSRLTNLSKRFYRALNAGDIERARQIRDESQKAYSSAASKGAIHRNKAYRKISRFDQALVKAGKESNSG